METKKIKEIKNKIIDTFSTRPDLLKNKEHSVSILNKLIGNKNECFKLLNSINQNYALDNTDTIKQVCEDLSNENNVEKLLNKIPK
tara:strand:- start:3094 stop:3351 length:258 start_codon:yes stop_codon:yes gene_type:complete